MAASITKVLEKNAEKPPAGPLLEILNAFIEEVKETHSLLRES